MATLPIKLWPGMKIGQLCFFRLSSPAEYPYGSAKYGSRYQGQRGRRRASRTSTFTARPSEVSAHALRRSGYRGRTLVLVAMHPRRASAVLSLATESLCRFVRPWQPIPVC